MPRSADVAVDVTLTNIARNYHFEKQRFVADIVAPVVPVSSFKGRYKQLGKELLNVHVDDMAADYAKTNSIDYDVSEATYTCVERRLKIFVSDREIKYAPTPLQPMAQAAITVKHAMMLRQEFRIAALADATSNTSNPANDWDTASATIVADVNSAIASFKNNLGFEPTHWLIPDDVADAIAGQATIVDTIQAAAAMGRPMQILNTLHGRALPAEMFGMKVLIPSAMYNTAEPGLTQSVSRIWGTNSYLFSVQSPGNGSTWAVQPQSTAFTIVRIRSEDPAGWWIKGVMERDEIEVTSEAVHEFTTVI